MCEYDKDMSALCFHHIDEDKEFGIGSSFGYKWETIQNELNMFEPCQCRHNVKGEKNVRLDRRIGNEIQKDRSV